jgi:hypothetical protein
MKLRPTALLVLILAACNLPANAASEATPSPATATQAAGGTPSEQPAEPTLTAPITFTRSQYTLTATLDYAAHYLAVSQQIIYTNNSAETLSEVPLIAAMGADFIAVEAITFEGGSEWQQRGDVIWLWLQQPLLPGEQINAGLEYALSVPQRAATFGWTERQMNFVDWYPFVPPRRDGAWLINEPTAQGEYLAYESANFEVSLYFANTPALFKVAAPAPASEEGSALVYRLQGARRFAWSAGGNYQTRTQAAGERGTPVTVYFFEEERDAANAALQTAAQALEIYEELFGPYPYESLAIIECSFPDGMESDGLFFLDMEYFRRFNYSARNLLVTLSAHETAHNWWFGAVGNDPAGEPWLDEALATYSELLYYERAHPADAEWWWGFRVNDWAPEGAVDSTAYELPAFRPYVNAVYLRGAQFLHAARATMGDKAFFAFLQDYYATNAGRIVSGDEFLEMLRGSTDVDLSEMIAEYFQ